MTKFEVLMSALAAIGGYTVIDWTCNTLNWLQVKYDARFKRYPKDESNDT